VGSHMDSIFMVMEYVEHDVKSLMDVMPNEFLQGEVGFSLLIPFLSQFLECLLCFCFQRLHR
jgi:cell division cycle 2-like